VDIKPSTHRLWTPEEDEVLTQRRQQRRPAAEIGAEIDRTPSAIYRRARELGLANVRRYLSTLPRVSSRPMTAVAADALLASWRRDRAKIATYINCGHADSSLSWLRSRAHYTVNRVRKAGGSFK